MAEMALVINKLLHERDAKEIIFEASEEVCSKIEPTGGDVLVCVYERPKEIIIGKDALGRPLTMDASATSRVLEDKLQGRVALVLKVGPEVEQHAHAFKDGKIPLRGDWVLVNGGDSVPFVGGYKPNTRVYRLVQANFVRAVLQDPDIVL